MSDKPAPPERGDPPEPQDAPPPKKEDYRLACQRYSQLRARMR
jgi:hypothetical protein